MDDSKLLLFDALKEHITAKVPEIKTFRLYNNQFEKEGVEKAFAFPAVFVEFSTLEYVTKSESLQEADTVVRFHLGFASLKTEDRDIFILAGKLNFQLQNFSIANLITAFDRKREEQDSNHDAVIVWKMEYNTLLTDNTANRKNKLRLVVGVPDLDVNVTDSPYYLKPS
jgi:hypothetical protein